MRFWTELLLANILFFSIPYFLNIRNQLNPFKFFFNKGNNIKRKLKFFYSKKSSDPFKIFVEFSAFILVANLFNFDINTSSIIAGFIGLIGTILILYVGVFHFIFRKPPMVLSDWGFIKVGITLLKNKRYLVYIFLAIVLFLIFWILYLFSYHLLSMQPSRDSIYVVLPIILGLGIFNAFSFGYYAFYDRTFYSPFIHFARNIKESTKFNYLLGKDEEYFKKFNLYEDLKLESKPNIVIINVESYGSINLRDDHFKSDFIEKLKEKEALLNENGFYSASSFSTPPMFAGGSWLSYTTLLFGTKVSDQNQYEILLKGNKGFGAYQSLPRYLKSNGYKNIYLCPLGGGFFQNVDWDVVSTNLNAHQYITFDDIEYEGKTLNFMDLGISAPDQFSINKAKEIIDKNTDKPYSLFYCTLNSHTPFNSPLEIEEDWSQIPSKDFKTNDNLTTKRDKYNSSIKYQLDFIFDYIKENKDDNTIYLLFGDHQPPFITKNEMGWETLIHVIAKDKMFIDSFKQNGFSKELVIDESQKPIKHEGVLSLFMQALLTTYGTNPLEEVPYLKNGVEFNKSKEEKNVK
jgi:phosphoglycerol transferase MdoB-like AlkP superfamily enzyme